MWRSELAVLTVICAAFATACAAPPAARSSTTPERTTTATNPATTAPATATATARVGVRYVAIGASDTVGVGASDPTNGSWPALVASRLPAGSPPYTNLGVSGSLALQAVTQQLPGAIAQKPDIVAV